MPQSFLATGKIDETYTPEQVVIGGSDVITKPFTIASGQNLPALSVVGRVTASGKLVLSDSGAADGSQTPVGIVVDAVDASAGDKSAPVYIAGEFNVDALNFHSSYSTAALKLAAFGVNGPIVLKKLAYSAI